MNPRGHEALARAGLLAGGLLAGALVAEAALRLGGYAPARFQSPGELYSPRARVFLDCYPTNPRGYFDVDLARPEVRARYEAMGVREVARVAARAPWAVEFRYNALYFRDREIAPKGPGVVRVAVLGDSFTEGQGVKEEDTFPRRLEARLREGGGSWEVMSCARRGADFPGLHKMFEKVLADDPDVVVYAMVLNDAARSPAFDARQKRVNDWILDRSRVLASGRPEAPRWLEPRLFDLVLDRLDRWRIGRESTRWYLEMYGGPNREGWERTQEYVRDMDARMRARRGTFLVASWPLLVDLDHYPFAAADEAIAGFCAKAGITRLDLRPALLGHPADALWVHPVDHHPNELAHRLVAEALLPAVRAAAPVPGTGPPSHPDRTIR